jgi:hypothetical protein
VYQIYPSSLIGIVGPFSLAEAGYYESLLYYKDINSVLEGACAGGYKELALSAIQMGASNFNFGLELACGMGHKETALLMIQNGADVWDFALERACVFGHKELIFLMIYKGANWKLGVMDACLWGHKELVSIIGKKFGEDTLCEYCGIPIKKH